ncbi:MAG: beta-N-acetylhexosaminidase [Kiritimatiellae bacterium]|nr:beta-N-acetylhexosaminidase [Kiritimatiellia bacterium]
MLNLTKKWALLLGFATCLALPLTAVIPLPQELQVLETPPFVMTEETSLVTDSAFRAEAEIAAEELRRSTGFALPISDAGAEITLPAIFFQKDTAIEGSEAYALEVRSQQVVIRAATPAGAFYGYQTFRQLLPPQVYSRTKRPGVKWVAPACTVKDAPRLQWRGLMVDDCRHFLGGAAIREMIDAMAAYKLNTLHWHLTDDQGWRIEIKAYPELTAKGATRDNSALPRDRWRPDGKSYGPYFYTQEEIHDIVAYAAARHITIVPEIEMPGHALCLLTAFPELSCTGGPFKPRWMWGVEPDILCAGNDAVFPFMEKILDEVMALFPSKYIHCGGDEAPKDRWNVCPKCQARIQEKGLRNSHHLQTWFIQHFADYLESKGRHLIGWDEILEGGLPKGAAVMSWRGKQGGIRAAAMGHNVVMAPNDYAYLDYGQGLTYAQDPYEYNGYCITVAKTYSIDPTAGIPEHMQRHVIGLQGNLWSEYIWDGADQQWKAWPRAAALSEAGWTAQEKRSWEDFAKRIPGAVTRLRFLGINCAPLPSPLEPVETK